MESATDKFLADDISFFGKSDNKAADDHSQQPQSQQQLPQKPLQPATSSHSSTDDFEHVEEQPLFQLDSSMEDNLLDFNSSGGPAASTTTTTTSNLVDTLLTDEDVPHFRVAEADAKPPAYLENEFMTTTTTTSNPAKDMEFSLGASAVKLTTDFMAAERGHHDSTSSGQSSQSPSPAKVAPQLVAPPPAAAALPAPVEVSHKETEPVPPMWAAPVEKKAAAEEARDLLESFIEPAPVVIEEPKVVAPAPAPIPTPAPVVPVAKPEPVIKETPVIPAPVPAPAAAAAVVPKSATKATVDKVEVITSAEEIFYKFGFGEWK